MIIFLESVVAACIAGLLCGYLGTYLRRLRLITLGFAVAHGAIAGASIAFMMGYPVEMPAFLFGVLAATLIEVLHRRFGVERDVASMYVFSFSSALAVIAIYSTPTILLTSDIASMILWGSILTMTLDKILILCMLLLLLLAYTRAFRLELDSILFDQKLAESEGVRVGLHVTVFILISSASVAILLRFVGGLLLFSLIFSPAIAATSISYRRQGGVGAAIGSAAGIIGVVLSFALDLPIGSTIAISSGMLSIALASIFMLLGKRKMRFLVLQSGDSVG